MDYVHLVDLDETARTLNWVHVEILLGGDELEVDGFGYEIHVPSSDRERYKDALRNQFTAAQLIFW